LAMDDLEFSDDFEELENQQKALNHPSALEHEEPENTEKSSDVHNQDFEEEQPTEREKVVEEHLLETEENFFGDDGEYGDGVEFGIEQPPSQPVVIEEECVALPYPRPPEDVPLYGTRIPSSLLLQPIPFDPDLYAVDTKPVISLNEAGKPVVTKTIHNAVRWRKSTDENGDLVKESNARIVNWSNGSMTLHVGSEVYEITVSDLPDFRDIYLRQRPDDRAVSFLQSHGIVSKKMSFNPTNITKWRNDTMNFRKAVQIGVKQGSRVVAGQNFADPDEEKRQKEQLEQHKIDLAQEFSRQTSKPISEQFLEEDDEIDVEGTDSQYSRHYDPAKEKENERKILAAKKGKRNRDTSSDEDEYDENDLFGDEDSEHTSKKKRH
jgi:RNA polymerase-associated protein LEO1